MHALDPLIADLRASGGAAHHRRLVVLAGPRPWGIGEAARIAAASKTEDTTAPKTEDDTLWLTDPEAVPGATPPAQARRLLGREAGTVIVDLHPEADPDLIGVTLGLARGGGLLLWLTPDLTRWPHQLDRQRDRLEITGWPPEAVGRRFVSRLTRLIEADPSVTVITPDGPRPAEALPAPNETPSEAPSDPACLTADQAKAVAALCRASTGRARRPVVLTADRGRGKSAALGIAAGRLLQDRPLKIWITAPARQSAAPALSMARQILGQRPGDQDLATAEGGHLRFISPGDLLDLQPEADFVLVDEAATLPLPHIATLLQRHPRLAFATTVHGYEGTGRGFTLKLPTLLDHHSRGWRAVRLQAPIRWAEGDPVEAFGAKALILDAEAPAPPEGDLDGAEYVRLDRDALGADEADLRDLFGLLITAHYRTGPSDLLRMLDSPNMEIHGLKCGGRWVSAALISAEGELDPALCADTLAGRRRPAGHMLPETLIYHSGLLAAGALRLGRIVRIATHPELQGQGLGRRLLAAIEAEADTLDGLGSVFGATPELLRFWRGAGFSPIRLGVKRGKSSGAFSAVVIHPLSPRAQATLGAEDEAFRARLPHQLADPLRDLSPDLALPLLSGPEIAPRFSARDLAEARRCAEGTQDPDLYTHGLWAVVCWALRDPRARARLSDDDQRILLRRVIQRRPWSELGVGRGQAVKAIRGALGALMPAAAHHAAALASLKP